MNPINQLDDIISIVNSIKPQIEALTNQHKIESSTVYHKLNQTQVNTLLNYLDRTTIYSGVGLQRGQKKAKPYYMPRSTNVASWLIVSTIKVSALNVLHVAINSEVNMFAVFINDFVICCNTCAEFIDVKPRNESNARVQFSWRFPSNQLTEQKFIPQEQYIVEPSEETEAISEEDKEMLAILEAGRLAEQAEIAARNQNVYIEDI